jgi:hypothetical protein
VAPSAGKLYHSKIKDAVIASGLETSASNSHAAGEDFKKLRERHLLQSSLWSTLYESPSKISIHRHPISLTAYAQWRDGHMGRRVIEEGCQRKRHRPENFARLVAISPALAKFLGNVSASFGPSPVNIMSAIAGRT